MRTTLAIDDDVLAAARALAAVQRRTVGETLSDLARRALQQSSAPAERNGVPLLPVSNPTARITLELVNELRDAPQ